MSDSVIHRFAADFKKVPGTLSVTKDSIAWVPNQAGAMDRQSQALARVTNMLASKAGAAKVSLKLVFKDDIPAGGLLFTFTNPTTSDREEDRKTVQDILIPYVSVHRGNAPAAGSPAMTPSTSQPGTPSAIAGVKRRLGEDGNPSSPGPSSMGTGNGTPDPAKKARNQAMNELRRKVLKKNPTLAALHHELVVAPDDPQQKISEREFWEGRESLIRAEEIAQAQKPGRQPRLIDDRFGLQDKGSLGVGGTGKGVKNKEETGPQTMSLRPEDISQIFEEFPVVADAYARYVPGISEVQFWLRYFQSQLWEQHRASERTTVNDLTAKKKDDIFDQYLEDPDNNVQPKQKLPDNIERFLDLSATEEDHGDVSTQRDVTMQAGREKGALPLIRRFNANAARLSKAPQNESSSNAGYLKTAMPDNTDIYEEIEYEDLRGPAVQQTISLEVEDTADKPEEGATRRGILPQSTEEELATFGTEYAASITSFSPSFEKVSLPVPPGGWEKSRIESGGSAEQAHMYAEYQAQKASADVASIVVKELHHAANAENATNVPIEPHLLDQMRSCHTAATEFLRQYWAALLPVPAGALGSGPSAVPKNKDARDPVKATKMANYLRSTEKKIEAVVHTATISGADAARVKAALAPTLGAVNVALAREKTRLANVAAT